MFTTPATWKMSRWKAFPLWEWAEGFVSRVSEALTCIFIFNPVVNLPSSSQVCRQVGGKGGHLPASF